MNIKLPFFFIICISILKSYSQEKDAITIQGEVVNNSKGIENVHVYNISKRKGTITNNAGKFELNVALNDTLYISSLQYKKLTIIVSQNNIASKQLIIELTANVNELDEVFLKHLSGNLRADMASRPKETTPQVGYVYSKKDLYKQLPDDSYQKSKRPNAHAITDPIGPLSNGISLPAKGYEKMLKQKRELALRKDFSKKIQNEFGIEYFTKDLKIEADQINNFLSYCEYYEIFEKYYDNKVLEVLNILKKESKTYNEIKH
ncbi:carboxypeptidase-like regulatory domain-containing protein [Lutibacter holmesii]|uniref:Carboxypeptidase-like regulatory domain-containing protein n=1 Tax=Lutibacter holmesii TaxID=1137985 RepID=A0ABW3WLI1_9FLAO